MSLILVASTYPLRIPLFAPAVVLTRPYRSRHFKLRRFLGGRRPDTTSMSGSLDIRGLMRPHDGVAKRDLWAATAPSVH